MATAPALAERLDGVPIVNRVEIEQLAPGTEHRFWLEAGSTPLGQPYLVPVMVMRGAEDGPRLWLSAAVHGDELNGVRVVQRLFDDLDPLALRGTVIGLPAVNLPGIAAHSRFFPLAEDGGSQVDLNRVWPGEAGSADAARRFAHDLWTGVAERRIDLAIDLHTQTRGAVFPLFVFADFRNPHAERLARALGPDMIKVDQGAAGSLETAFIEAGVPAVTLEIGGPKRFDEPLIRRALDGLRALMVGEGMLDEPVAERPPPFVGQEEATVRAVSGGFVEVLVELGDDVIAGQPIARQVDLFGNPIARYTAPFDGRVLSIATDPLREPGAMLVRLLRALQG
ncbi:MAG: succinylglutamate desuccinylase/aspartoacylase family protein [Pseudomonadota bacterium]